MIKRVRITNESVNGYKFRVLTDGIDLEQYKRNPVLLYMHERGNVIGIVDDLQVANGEITGILVFDEASELSIRCKKQFEKGSLRMVSIGIDPIEVSSAPELLLEGQERPTVTKSKLVEISLVDIGANDDAIVMKDDGTVIELGKDGNCPLPLLNNNIKKDVKMDLKKLALQLGLPETADEAIILAKITELQKTAGDAVTLKAENDKLTLAGITTLVDGAISEKKLTAENRDHFIELGKKVGAEELEKTLKAMAPQVKLSGMLKPAAGAPGAVVTTYTKLSEVPADELLKLRQDDKETYRRLYKAEYGMECEI
jgi:hypothetical protein